MHVHETEVQNISYKKYITAVGITKIYVHIKITLSNYYLIFWEKVSTYIVITNTKIIIKNDGSEVCNVVVQRNKKIFDFTSSL